MPGSNSALRRLLGLAVGITLTLIAWGYLVWLAIDFGAEARSGEPWAWALLGTATVGATACLFLTLILLARAARVMKGAPPPPKGGKRRAR